MPGQFAHDSRAAMGQRVRALRESRGLTLQALSDRSGLAISTISKIERGLMAPTYDRFSGLAEGLGVDIADLFAAQETAFETGTVDIARAIATRPTIDDSPTYEMLFSDVRSKAMRPMVGTLKPLQKMQFEKMKQYPGQEFLMVLQGTVVVQLEGRDDVSLAQGDAIYFDSGRGHFYAAEGEDDARILVVCTDGTTIRAQPS